MSDKVICSKCYGAGNCQLCNGTITKKLSGEIKINVKGHNSNEVRDVLVAFLDRTNTNNYIDEIKSIHPNIKLLLKRMDRAVEVEDYSSALHASASIFETLAKDIIGSSSISNQTLASFFDRYRKESNLPSEVLDFVLSIYKSRNTTPLAGHGSIKQPDISKESAIILSEMTRAFLRIEYRTRTSNNID